jgi:hypothetical protein
MALRSNNFGVCKALLQANRVPAYFEYLLASAELMASVQTADLSDVIRNRKLNGSYYS